LGAPPTNPIVPTPAVASGPAAGTGLPARYILNLISLALFGVLASAWVLYYTDSFEIVGGLLALGGAFSWLAFLSKAMPEERLKGLQAWIDDHILMKKWLSLLPLGLIALGTALASFLGTVQVEALGSGGAVLLEPIKNSGETSREWLPIAQGRHVRELVWTFPGSPTAVQVKFVGLPMRIVKVYSWRRLELQGPESFERPVVILRPTLALMQSRANSPLLLLVRSDSEEKHVEFSGEAVWVGSDPEIELPPVIIDSWQAEIQAKGLHVLPERWLHPLVVDSGSRELRVGENLVIELHSKSGSGAIGPLWACGLVYQVRRPIRPSDFVQQVVLDVQKSTDRKCSAEPKQEMVLVPQ
jgi:hypothetical protein